MKKIVSVFIPTYNGDSYIEESLNSVLKQKLPENFDLELIVIDSGSTDRTLDILKSFKNKIRLLEIPNIEFGHGKTRQRAAEIAYGEYILFLSQDATPLNDRWLINMIEPFCISEKVGCVFGKQIPRPDAAATIKREVNTVFGSLGSDDSVVLSRSHSLVDGTKLQDNFFFSDVNSAVRRSLLTGEIPFRDVSYAEDQALAQDMLTKGFMKSYAPLGAVIHSNMYTWKEYYHRKFDEYSGLRESTKLVQKPSLRSLFLGWIRPTFKDYIYTLKDSDYRFISKMLWIYRAPLYNIALKKGMYDALSHNSKVKFNKRSLEKRTKNKA